MSALQLDNDSEMGNWETRLNMIQMVNTFHKPSSIFELMYVVVQVNGIGVKALVDTGATYTCVASSVDTNLGLIMDAYDNVVTSLNGRDYWVESIIRFCPLEMEEWMGCCVL